MFKKIAAGVITAVLSLGAVVFLAGPASAHHNTIWPEVTCAVDGTYNISWSVENSETNKTEVITQSNQSFVPTGTSFGFHEKKYFPQNVSTPQSITLTLTGFWDGDPSTKNDDVYNTTSYTLTADRFPTGCLTVTPKVDQNPSVCNGPNTYTDPSYTITDVTGVKYTVDGQPKAPGTYPATNGSSVHIEASVTDSKYKITGTKVWDFTFTAPADGKCTVEVDPVTPEVKQQVCTGPGQHKLAQYIIPNKTGVLYSVKINGVENDVLPGTYDVPEGVTSIQIIARGDAAKYYTLKGGTKIYDFTFDLTNKCLVDLKPKTPQVSDGQCDVANHPGVVPPLSYSLTGVDGVVYQVSKNGGTSFDDVIVANGATQTFDATPGMSLVVRAVSADATKWTVTFTEYTHTFGNPGDCKFEVTPVAPAADAQYCDETDPRNPFLVSGTITLTAATGVDYFIDGVPAQAGVAIPVANGVHSITTYFDPSKYKLAAGAVGSFTIEVKAGECLPTEPLVTPLVTSTQMGCFTNGSYTLSNDLKDADAVIWTVNGSQVKQGKYTVFGAGTVKITAAPNAPVYGFQQGVQTSWTYDFKKPSVCDTETLAMTGGSPTGLLLAGDMLVVAGLVMFAMRAVRRGRTQQA